MQGVQSYAPPHRFITPHAMHEPSARVSQLLADRDRAHQTLLSSTAELIRLGVTFSQERPPEAFTALAIFDDGSTLKLYEGTEPETTIQALRGKGLDHLVGVEWLSAFDGENDNTDRRIHVGLNWQRGLFTFHNVVGPQRFTLKETDPHTRDLVLFRRRMVRMVAGAGGIDLAPEQVHYTLYGIGMREIVDQDVTKEQANVPYAKSRILLIDPLGGVEWEA